MKCYYHQSDLDGQCSAAIVKYAYPECYLISIDYGQKFDFKSCKNQTVFMVDFTLEPFKQMNDLNNMADLIWIDHHIVAIKEAEEEGFNPEGVRDTNLAACELTWNYCFPDTPIPYFVKLLGRYDIWDHDSSKHVIPFQYGMKAYETNPNYRIWSSLFNDTEIITTKIINEGKIIIPYAKKYNQRYAKARSFETIFEDLECICCNKGLTNSFLFNSVWDEKRHDMMVTFCRTPNKRWLVSLYTSKEGVNCGKIAKKYGGGGHTQAAGFTCKKLPFEI